MSAKALAQNGTRHPTSRQSGGLTPSLLGSLPSPDIPLFSLPSPLSSFFFSFSSADQLPDYTGALGRTLTWIWSRIGLAPRRAGAESGPGPVPVPTAIWKVITQFSRTPSCVAGAGGKEPHAKCMLAPALSVGGKINSTRP